MHPARDSQLVDGHASPESILVLFSSMLSSFRNASKRLNAESSFSKTRLDKSHITCWSIEA
jgi:hypothetical protein